MPPPVRIDGRSVLAAVPDDAAAEAWATPTPATGTRMAPADAAIAPPTISDLLDLRLIKVRLLKLLQW
jgi:hypothetical protein